MKTIVFKFVVICCLIFTGTANFLAAQTTYESAQSGNFSDGSTWVGGQPPPASQHILIKSGHTVTLDRGTDGSDYILVWDVTIEDGAVLNNNGWPLWIRPSASSMPQYKNDGIHNGPGTIQAYQNGGGRIDGNGSTNLDIEYDLQGTLQVRWSSNLAINGNIKPTQYGFASGTSIVPRINYEVFEGVGGALTVNGDIYGSGITDRPSSIIIPAEGTLIVNGNINFNANSDMIQNSGTFTVTGDLTLGANTTSYFWNRNQSYAEIGGDVLGGGSCFLRNGNDAYLKLGGQVFPAGFGGTFSILNQTALNTVEYSSSSAQIIRPTTVQNYSNLIINNSSAAGVALADNIAVNGTLTLNNGHVHLNDKNLILGASATIGGSPSAEAMVVATGTGELRKSFDATGSFTFPVGDNDGVAEYSPVTLEFTSGTFSSGHVGLNLKNETYPGLTGSHIKRYWNINSTGISAFNSNLTLKYIDDDVIGNESAIYCFRVAPTANIFSKADTDLKLLTANGLTAFGVFSGQAQLLPGKNTAQSGNYSDGSTWVGGIAPSPSDDIVIRSGHTVTLDVAGIDVHDITIEAGAIFDNGDFDLRIQKSGGNPTYKNDGIHNSGSGNLILFNGYFTRVRGTGVSNINFNVRDHGIQPLYDCDLTINGNLQHNTNVTNAQKLLIWNNEGGSLTINGNIVPHPSKGVSIINDNWETYEANITVNGNVDLSSIDAFSGEGTNFTNNGIFTVSGDVIISPGMGFILNYGEITIGGDLLGSSTGDDWESIFVNEGLLKIGGNIFPAAPNLGNFGLGLNSTVEYFGNSHQTIFYAWDETFVPTGLYHNLIINNSSAAGVALADNIAVNGTLTLNNGHVHLNDKNLILGASATIGGSPSAEAMVVATGTGELRKAFDATGSFTFPVGDNDGVAEYSPVTIQFTSGTFSSGHVGLNLKNETYPGLTGSHIKRYWNINSTGISAFNCNLTLKYNDDDVIGNEDVLYCYRVAPTANIFSKADADLIQLSANGLNSFGVFTGKKQRTVLPGDVNDDGSINVLDLVWLVLHLGDNTPFEFNYVNADVNSNGEINITDLTELISSILTGEKQYNPSVKSEAAYLYLEEGGVARFESDGTLLAMSFELVGDKISDMSLDLTLSTDHTLAYNNETGKGVIYSLTNSAIPDGKIELFNILNVDDLAGTDWGPALASNINSEVVNIITHSIYAIGEDDDSDDNDDNDDNGSVNIENAGIVHTGFSIFPNPGNGNFTLKVQFPEISKIDIEIMDAIGNVVFKSKDQIISKEEQLLRYSLSQKLNTGLYFIRITGIDSLGRHRAISQKLIVIK